MNLSTERNIACFLLLGATLFAGCSEYPCLDESTVHELATLPFTYDQKVRYTYWFEDGAQRITFDREQVPENARGAVLVHLDKDTAGGLHGATGWAADVSNDDGARATYVPMAIPRSAAYSAWVGAWSATWIDTRAGLLIQEINANRAMEEALRIRPPDEEKPASLNPMDIIKNLAGEKDEPRQVAVPEGTPADLGKELREQGISVDGLKLSRALRVVGARQPVPRDFGLSVDVHPVWLYVSDDCDTCDAAMAWLDGQGIGYHAMRVADPTNAKNLKSLSARAGIKPAVPMLWRHVTLLRGFDANVWTKELQ